MKLKIRCKVFETNSSSAHSIVIIPNKDFKIKKIIIDSLSEENKKFVFGDRYFSCECDVFSDWKTKADYAFISYKNDEFIIEDIKSIIKKYTDIDAEFNSSNGEIDHQSINVLKDEITNGLTLEEFIFNPNILLYIKSDCEVVYENKITE